MFVLPGELGARHKVPKVLFEFRQLLGGGDESGDPIANYGLDGLHGDNFLPAD